MPTFKLDDKEIPFEPGDTIIRAAWRQGIEIPHYCWHPGLSVAANCRMCLVEVRSGRKMALPVLEWSEKKKKFLPKTKDKLAPACQMAAQEGMEVYSKSDAALKAQDSTQEFLLLNHPVDCPICDQAGECKLQDYFMTSMSRPKRKLDEPVHKPKAVEFGPTITYDAERCIMCTRCVRFCDEVVGDPVLDMRERGNRNEITVSPGRELDHDYTMMTAHVCPVGALTTKDFRFKARVWFLRSADSICTGCASGCNTHIDFDPRSKRVHRLRPRENEDVNSFWMCDDGMMSYRQFIEDRIMSGRVASDAAVEEVTRETALTAASKMLSQADPSRVAFVLSAQHSSEDNYVLTKLAKVGLGSSRLYLAALGGWRGDHLMRHPDNNPNRAGALAVAGQELPLVADLVKAVEAGEIDAVVSLGWATAADEETLQKLRGLPLGHVNLTTNAGSLTGAASIVIPVASVAESEGTFVNAKGMAQQFKRAFEPVGGLKPGWATLLELASLLEVDVQVAKLSDVRQSMRALPKSAGAEAGAAAPAS